MSVFSPLKTRVLWFILLASLVATVCFGESRVWTDKTGREIRAEFVSATKYKVKICREADHQVFEVALTSLSQADQAYVAERKWAKQENATANGNDRIPRPSKVENQTTEPSPLGEGIVPDRIKIPSLGVEELGEGYPSGPSNLVNILVWWGDTIAPESMPHSKRERSVERIAQDIESYFRDDSNSIARIREGMMRYSEHKLDGYAIEYKGQRYAPCIDELSELTNSWYGTVAVCGIYEENSSGDLRRVGGRYMTLVDVQGQAIIQNLMGRQYSLLMSDKVVGPERFPASWAKRMIEGSDRKGYLQVADPSLVPGHLFPKDKAILLEMVGSFELLKLPDTED